MKKAMVAQAFLRRHKKKARLLYHLGNTGFCNMKKGDTFLCPLQTVEKPLTPPKLACFL